MFFSVFKFLNGGNIYFLLYYLTAASCQLLRKKFFILFVDEKTISFCSCHSINSIENESPPNHIGIIKSLLQLKMKCELKLKSFSCIFLFYLKK